MDNKQILSEIFVQITGFLIVFLVLKHFAWSKLLGIIDTRRKTIEDIFAGLEKRKQEIDGLEKEYRRRIDRIEDEARAKIQEAAQSGLALSKEIEDKARADAQKMIANATAEIEQDLAKARLLLRDQIVEISSLLTEKLIREKLSAAEHQRLVEQFIKEMEGIR